MTRRSRSNVQLFDLTQNHNGLLTTDRPTIEPYPTEQSVIAENNRQLTAIWAIGTKDEYALGWQEKLEQLGLTSYCDGLKFMQETEEKSGINREFQAYLHEFVRQVGVRDGARHRRALLDVAVVQIGRVVHQSPYPPPPLPEPRSLREWLFGKNEKNQEITYPSGF